MRCPACKARGACIDSRMTANHRRRRWECIRCHTRFTSAEFVVWQGEHRNINVVHAWLGKIKQQGAADLIAKLDALLNPWRERHGGPTENPGAQQDLPAGDVQIHEWLAVVSKDEKPPDCGGIDREL